MVRLTISAQILAVFAPEGPAADFAKVLSTADLQELAQNCTIREYTANTAIYHEGDRAESLSLVLEGEIKLCKVKRQGRECVLCLVKTGRIIDPAVLYYQAGYPASAFTVTRCRILRMPCQVLRTLAAKNAELALLLVRALSHRHRLFINKAAESQGVISVSRRVASWLLHRSKICKTKTIELMRTRELLAQLLGVSRESLCRELNNLDRAGVIRLDKKQVQILNETSLRKCVEE